MEPGEVPNETDGEDGEVETTICRLLDLLNEHKPNDRSEKDRLWAIMRTDAQKLLAFWLYLEMQ